MQGRKCAAVNGLARCVSHKSWMGTATALSQRTELTITPTAMLVERSGLARANIRGHAEATDRRLDECRRMDEQSFGPGAGVGLTVLRRRVLRRRSLGKVTAPSRHSCQPPPRVQFGGAARPPLVELSVPEPIPFSVRAQPFPATAHLPAPPPFGPSVMAAKLKMLCSARGEWVSRRRTTVGAWGPIFRLWCRY